MTVRGNKPPFITKNGRRFAFYNAYATEALMFEEREVLKKTNFTTHFYHPHTNKYILYICPK